MASRVKFYLERRKDEKGNIILKDVPIFLFFSYHGKRLQYYTGLRLDDSKWDTELMRVEKNRKEAASYNRTLERLKRWVEEIDDNAKALGESLTLEQFRERLRQKSGTDDQIKSAKSFRELFEEYIEVSKLSKKERTVGAIQTVLNNLNGFSKHTKTALEFGNINQDFYNKLLEYCFYVKQYKNNNTGKIIKVLKAFMNWATEQGHNKNLEFRKKSFKKLFELPEIVFLTYDELIKLYNLKLEDEELKKVRDVFCFGCFTGMRYSDIAAMTRENIHKDSIVYRITKTDEVNNIPLNSYLREILSRYKKNEKPLPVMAQVRTNELLTDLAEKAKLNRKIKITHFRGGERIVTISPLKELITFHVSKKTFMTNFLARGGSLETAMAITGNKDYKTAKRYFKVVDALKADEMRKVFGQ